MTENAASMPGAANSPRASNPDELFDCNPFASDSQPEWVNVQSDRAQSSPEAAQPESRSPRKDPILASFRVVGYIILWLVHIGAIIARLDWTLVLNHWFWVYYINMSLATLLGAVILPLGLIKTYIVFILFYPQLYLNIISTIIASHKLTRARKTSKQSGKQPEAFHRVTSLGQFLRQARVHVLSLLLLGTVWLVTAIAVTAIAAQHSGFFRQGILILAAVVSWTIFINNLIGSALLYVKSRLEADPPPSPPPSQWGIVDVSEETDKKSD